VESVVDFMVISLKENQMNKTIITILSTLITAFIVWISYTVYETSVKVVVIENNIEMIYPVLQDLSER
jgi:hypothetical protein